MSYTIVYDRRFLKCGDLYIPMALFGDNNVTETDYRTGREVRVRRWETFSYSDDMLLASADRIMEIVAQFHPKDSSEGESFRFRGEFLNDAETYRFFENGIRGAMSIEDIALQTHNGTVVGEMRAYDKELADVKELCVKPEYLHRTSEIVDFIERAKTAKAEAVKDDRVKYAYISLKFMTRDPLQVTPVKDRTVPVIARTVRSKFNRCGYLKSFTESSASYDVDVSKAYVFENIDEAYLSVPSWLREYIRFAPKPSDAKAPAEREYCLTAMYNGRRVFIQKKTRGSTYYSDNPSYRTKRFASEKEALRWFRKYLEPHARFTDPEVKKC